MDVQVLVATMNQNDHSLIKKMNINSHAIVANQCNKNSVDKLEYNGHFIKYLNCAEKGVGLNRNNALLRAEAKYSILADDDLVFKDNYPEIVKEMFSRNPNYEVMIFNFDHDDQNRYVIKKKHRIYHYNYMRYGAARIAFKTRSVTKNGICFNLHFGGGAEFGSGEDTLFLQDCLKNKLKILAVPISLASIEPSRKSTWFQGYSPEFFRDKGALFAAVSRRFAKLLSFQFAFRKRKQYKKEMNTLAAYKNMLAGIKMFRSIK